MRVLDYLNRKLSERRLRRLYRPDDFRMIVSREQRFSGRSDSNASVIIFDTGAAGSGVTAAERLVRTIRSTTRMTDVVGWYDYGHIGVLLPDTPMEGAQRVLTSIWSRMRECANGASLPPAVIHTYAGGEDIEYGNGDRNRDAPPAV